MTMELTRYQVQAAMAEWDGKLAAAEERLSEASLNAALGGDGKAQEEAAAEVRSIQQKLAGLQRGLALVAEQEREADKAEAAKRRRGNAIRIRALATVHDSNVYALHQSVLALKAQIGRADQSGQQLREAVLGLDGAGLDDEYSREGGAIKNFLMCLAAFSRTDAAFRAKKGDYGDHDPDAMQGRGRFLSIWEQTDARAAWSNLARVLPEVMDEAVKEESRELALELANAPVMVGASG